MQHGAWQEAAPREEAVRLLYVGIDEHVLPRDEDVIHNKDGIVFVEPARQRVIERTAQHSGALLVRNAADEFDALGITRHEEHDREVFVLHWKNADTRRARWRGQCRAG